MQQGAHQQDQNPLRCTQYFNERFQNSNVSRCMCFTYICTFKDVVSLCYCSAWRRSYKGIRRDTIRERDRIFPRRKNIFVTLLDSVKHFSWWMVCCYGIELWHSSHTHTQTPSAARNHHCVHKCVTGLHNDSGSLPGYCRD